MVESCANAWTSRVEFDKLGYSKQICTKGNAGRLFRVIEVGDHFEELDFAVHDVYFCVAGPQNGSVVSDNYISHQGTQTTGALYPDEGSAYSLWTRNVVTDIGDASWCVLP